METTNRYLALELASRGVSSTASTADTVRAAGAYLAFLDGTDGAKTGEAASLKGRGKGKSPRATETATTQTKTDDAAPATDAAASASPSKGDDMFGEDEKPAETKKEEKTKKLTLDDVRAALVAAQTALKSKDKAVALLTEVAGAAVLSKLKEEDFGKLIDKCNAAAKAAA